jgi:hypothetical protein
MKNMSFSTVNKNKFCKFVLKYPKVSQMHNIYFRYLSHTFRLLQRSHHQAAQNYKKEIVYINAVGENSTLQINI